MVQMPEKSSFEYCEIVASNNFFTNVTWNTASEAMRSTTVSALLANMPATHEVQPTYGVNDIPSFFVQQSSFLAQPQIDQQ